jgi:aspartate-semialdehyde dehydrogenase
VSLKIAIVGATGLVGRTILKVLEEKDLPEHELILLASPRSAGKKLSYKNSEIKIMELKDSSFKGVDIALFSSGGNISMNYVPIAQKAGCLVIDNSSAWRLHPDVPLSVPEVNPESMQKHCGIIANPNCSTIQLLVAIKPILDKYGIERMVCSTYQSISGAGQSGISKLNEELGGKRPKDQEKSIAYNTLFHPFEENNFTNEENKMFAETRKILSLPNLKLAFTCVRLPILGGHAESVNLELSSDYDLKELRSALKASDGISLVDVDSEEEYPTPAFSYKKDEVFIGRLRRDTSAENGLYLWIVSDNLRKGAATNAVQIAEYMINNNLLKFDLSSWETPLRGS